ncbi:MAG TPA: hypothetical protein VHG32_05195 [Thermoanaerobaculia bacterium]|jgi:hypothetical protein|nr:hypothetical protein [Thermoanaerobaculia bacterium]
MMAEELLEELRRCGIQVRAEIQALAKKLLRADSGDDRTASN